MTAAKSRAPITVPAIAPPEVLPEDEPSELVVVEGASLEVDDGRPDVSVCFGVDEGAAGVEEGKEPVRHVLSSEFTTTSSLELPPDRPSASVIIKTTEVPVFTFAVQEN